MNDEWIFVQSECSYFDPYEPLEEVFRRFGFRALVGPKRFSFRWEQDTGRFLWEVIVTAPITLVAAKFFGAMAEEAGKDAWANFKERTWPGIKIFVRELAKAHHPADLRHAPVKDLENYGLIRVEDPDGLHLIIFSDLPDSAFEQLSNVNWTDITGRIVFWSNEQHRWMDAPLEIEQPPKLPPGSRLSMLFDRPPEEP